MSEDQARWESGRPVGEVGRVFVMPIDPATEWSERPVTTAVEIPRHTHAAVSAGRGRTRQTWVLSGYGPAGSEPGPAKWLALAVAVFRLWMRTSWEQAIGARRG